MPPLTIRANGATATPGDFGAVVRGTDLLVPRRLAKALAGHGVRDAAEFVSYVDTFPTAIADDLGWEVGDVVRALGVLRAQLRGRVADAVLDPAPPAPRRFGALDPRTLRGRKTPVS